MMCVFGKGRKQSRRHFIEGAKRSQTTFFPVRHLSPENLAANVPGPLESNIKDWVLNLELFWCFACRHGCIQKRRISMVK